MIVYEENLKESIKKKKNCWSGIINKVAGYKVNIQKIFFYSNNKQVELEIKTL